MYMNKNVTQLLLITVRLFDKFGIKTYHETAVIFRLISAFRTCSNGYPSVYSRETVGKTANLLFKLTFQGNVHCLVF